MPTKIFLNLPVHDLPASIAFFTALGFSFNPKFTDETATCMIISDKIFSMLLTHERFRSFSPNPISNAHKETEMLIALSRGSREEVDEIVTKAIAAGGHAYAKAVDHGFMYQHGFQDLDGHCWEVFWMDEARAPAG